MIQKGQLQNTWRITHPSKLTPIVAIAPTMPPTVADFIEKLRIMYGDDSFYNEYVLDNGIVVQKYPQIDAIVGTPTVADFGTGKYRRRIIFDESSPCSPYYLDSGNVKRCSKVSVGSTSSTPTASDFTGDIKFLFDESNPCDVYYLSSGTATKCSSSSISSTSSTPTASDFTGGIKFLLDESSPCDMYYLDSGTVKKCSGGGNSYRSIRLYGSNAQNTYRDDAVLLSQYDGADLIVGTWLSMQSAEIKIQSVGDTSIIDFVEVDCQAGGNPVVTTNVGRSGTVVGSTPLVFTQNSVPAGYDLLSVRVKFKPNANVSVPQLTI